MAKKSINPHQDYRIERKEEMINEEKKRPNILWICTDQQRYDTIQSLGNPYLKTPNIDALVENGVAFLNAYAQSPLCTPSRSSFLTGRYPRSTRSSINGNTTFSRDETLVTKMLADAGYTCGLVGKLHLTAAYKRMEERTDDGYSYMEWSHMPIDNWEPGINRYQTWLKEKGIDWNTEYESPCPDWPPTSGYPLPERIKGMTEENHQTTWCVEKTMEFIGQNKDKPWVASVNIYAPHPPFDPPETYKDRLNIEDMPLPLYQEGELDNKPACQKDCYLNGSQNGMLQPTVTMSDLDKQETTRDYYALIEHVDSELGRLLQYLDDLSLREDTIIIFMSDHGEMLGDHGIYWKGGYFYEGLIHVPLIINWPKKFKQGIRPKALVELVDIAPTLLEVCGLPIPDYMQGKSFANILYGTQSPDHHKDSVYAEYYYSAVMLHEVYATMYFDGRHKMIVHHDSDISELYDLEADPSEFENLWNTEGNEALQNRLVKACFDQVIMKNIDCVMGRQSNY